MIGPSGFSPHGPRRQYGLASLASEARAFLIHLSRTHAFKAVSLSLAGIVLLVVFGFLSGKIGLMRLAMAMLPAPLFFYLWLRITERANPQIYLPYSRPIGT